MTSYDFKQVKEFKKLKMKNEALIELQETRMEKQESMTSLKNHKIQNINKVHIDVPEPPSENQKSIIDMN